MAIEIFRTDTVQFEIGDPELWLGLQKINELINKICKSLAWNCTTPAIVRLSRKERDLSPLSPMLVVPLKKQKNMPVPMGEGLARDEAMNHGQRVIYCILCLVSDIELTESFNKKS